MKKLIALTFILSSVMIADSSIAQQGGRWGSTKTSTLGADQKGYYAQSIADMPFEDVNETEEGSLVYMREEEKLARDLYRSFYEKWKTPIFDNISKSEQKHTDSINALLTKYQITDPVTNNEKGIFTNSELQEIYNELITSGSLSFFDALKVGAAVEELDISDLTQALEQTDSQDIKTVYENLLKGSRNHLRSYVQMINNYGQDYEAVYLTPEEVETIVSSEMERGFY